MLFVSGSVDCLEVPQKPSPSPPPQSSYSRWRIWEWGAERGLIFSPSSPHLLLQTSFSFFSTTTTWCLLQGTLKLCLPALFILSFSEFYMLLPLSSHLSCRTLKEWSLFSDFLKKEFLSWGWRLWANTEDNGTSLPEKCVLFLSLSGKGFILCEAEELLSLPVYSLIFPGQHQDAHSPFS